MCAISGLKGEVSVRPYLALNHRERDFGRLFPHQIAIHSSGRAAAIPYEAKEWGPTGFTDVARLLKPHAKLVQIGAKSDPALPVDADLRGKTTLREAAAILAGSDLFIGLEGFLTHLARAVDCPSVVILGGRAPAEIFGYSANRNLTDFPECGPCARRIGCPHGLKCMTAITPPAVTAAALEVLSSPPNRPLAHVTAVLP
jgi:ADP-heptose:LPS heptosyltransferase